MFARTTTVPAPGLYCRALRPGLTLRCSDRAHGHDGASEAQAEAGLHLVLVLEGQIDLAYGPRALCLGPALTSDVLMVHLAEPEGFRRAVQDVVAGAERKLSIELGRGWLQESGLALSSRARARHLQIRQGRVSRHQRQLGEAVLRALPQADALSGLRVESLVLELLGELLAPPASASAQSATERVARAPELLASGAADGWSLADIALELGVHINTLQRLFREQQGCSVFDYLRRCRLQRARRLLQQGISVTEAALEAGYGSPANFSTAFKREFGHSPGQLCVET